MNDSTGDEPSVHYSALPFHTRAVLFSLSESEVFILSALCVFICAILKVAMHSGTVSVGNWFHFIFFNDSGLIY